MRPPFSFSAADLLDRLSLKQGAVWESASAAAGRHLSRLAERARAVLVPQAKEEEQGGAVLWLILASSRWEAVVVGPELPEPARFGEDCAFASEEAPISPEALARRALAAIPEQIKSAIGRVVVAGADPHFEFSDNRALRIPDTDPTGARTVASQQFGGASASFGFMAFGDSSEREQQRRLYGFAPSERLRSYLYGLDKLALSLSSLVPLPTLLLDRVAEGEQAGEPYALIYLGDYFTQIFVVNPETGTVAARAVRIGALSLAAGIAQEMGFGLRQAAAGLKRRDRLSRLRPDRPGGDIAAQTTFGSIVAKPLRELSQAFDETVSYFSHQRLAGDPERIILCGETDRVPGFAGWLAAAAGLTVETEARPWSALLMAEDAPRLNLLDGAPDDLLTIGKTAYLFRNGRFVPQNGEMPATQASAQKPAATQEAATGLDALRARFWWLKAPDAKYFAGVAGLLAVAGFFDAQTVLGSPGTSVAANAASYANLISQNEKIEARRAAEMQAAVEDQVAMLDPGSWSERLVAVAHHIGPTVWLRRLSVAEPGHGRAQSRQLIIEGRLPRDGDYLGEIGAFVDRLNKDEGFMRGLSRLAFEGAKAGDDTSAPVDFALTATYGAVPAGNKH